MTTEQKFKQLLDLAITNGFDKSNTYPSIIAGLLNTNFQIDNIFGMSIGGYITNQFNQKEYYSYSLNDLIINTNFFDCLFNPVTMNDLVDTDKPIINTGIYIEDSVEYGIMRNLTSIQYLKTLWMLEVERNNALQWLFYQFDL